MLNVSFMPQVVRQCSDISEELKKFSITFKLDLNVISFKILEVYTYLINADGKEELIDDNNLHYLEDDAYYNTPDFRVIQRFDIKIIPKNEQVDIALKFSESNNCAFLYFYEDNFLQDTEEFFTRVVEYAENELVLHKVILRHRNKRKAMIAEQIKEKIKNKTSYPLYLVVDESASYVPAKSPYFVFVPMQQYKGYKQEFEHAFFAVNQGEIILKYYRAIKSSPGRDIFGRFVKNDDEQLEDLDIPGFSEEYAILEDKGESVWIKSLVNAFVCFSDHKISFFKQELLENVDIHNTPLLLGGQDKQVRLEVVATDPLKDAVASGVILEAGEIVVKGNVASNVILKAKNLEIEGQTHQNTKIEAVRAKILSHKGNLIAKFAEVGSVEIGSIEAEKIEAKYCNGGKLMGSEIKIAELENNNKITFNHRLYLENISGEHNEIIFYSFVGEKTRDLAQALVEKKEKILQSAKKVFAKYQKLNIFVTKYRATIDSIKNACPKAQAQMLQNKKIRIVSQRYDFALEEIQRIKAELLEFDSLIKHISVSLIQLDDEILEAQVFCDRAWGDDTRLCYQREYPKKTIKVFSVDKEFEGNYKLDKQTREFVRA